MRICTTCKQVEGAIPKQKYCGRGDDKNYEHTYVEVEMTSGSGSPVYEPEPKVVSMVLPTPPVKERPSFEHLFMKFAFDLARRSTCQRLQVGCVIASPDFRKIISLGYNGGAAGLENECESLAAGACGHIHAECNAIINCDVPRATPKLVVCTDLPCPMCSKMLINLGNVQKVIYARDYRIRDGVELLKRAGIVVETMPVGDSK